jgi:hypothetical protein
VVVDEGEVEVEVVGVRNSGGAHAPRYTPCERVRTRQDVSMTRRIHSSPSTATTVGESTAWNILSYVEGKCK